MTINMDRAVHATSGYIKYSIGTTNEEWMRISGSNPNATPYPTVTVDMRGLDKTATTDTSIPTAQFAHNAGDAVAITTWHTQLHGQNTDTGTNSATFTIATNLILSSSGLSAPRTFTFPNLTGTVATLNSAQTFTATQTFTTSVLGVATATTVNKVTITQPAVGATLTIDDGVTLHVTGNVTSLSGSHTGSSSGTNTGDQTNISGNAATVTTNANLTGPITSVGNATSVASQTGTGTTFVMNTSPTLVTPVLGVATATTINKVTFTAPATGSTLTIANGKTLTVSNTLTFTGTDSSSVAFGAGGTVAYTSNNLSIFAATTSAQLAGIISDETGSGALVFATSPTLVTPILGVATATSINKLTITAPATSATLTIVDGGSFITAGAFSTTLTSTGATNVTLPTTGTLATLSGTETLANKRVTPKTGTVASSATPTINTDTTDIFTITALATTITSMTTNLSGTPTLGQKLIVRILDNGSSRGITWGASFASRGATLPTSTTASKYTYVGLIWNSTTNTWDCIATCTEA
jgi:hypothetical protein